MLAIEVDVKIHGEIPERIKNDVDEVEREIKEFAIKKGAELQKKLNGNNDYELGSYEHYCASTGNPVNATKEDFELLAPLAKMLSEARFR